MIKWTLRLLFVLVFMMGATLLMVNILSGPGDAQKKGLEGALSKVFDGEAHINTLKTFNILPQFDVSAADVSIEMKSKATIKATQFRIAFAFIDLFTGNHHIEALDLQNLEMSKDVFGHFAIQIATATIQQKENKGVLVVDGTLDTQKLHLTLDLESFPTTRPSFALRESNPFLIILGQVKTIGNLVPYKPDYKTFTNVSIEGFGKTCAFGENSAITGDAFLATVLEGQTSLKNALDFAAYCAKITKSLSQNTQTN